MWMGKVIVNLDISELAKGKAVVWEEKNRSYYYIYYEAEQNKSKSRDTVCLRK